MEHSSQLAQELSSSSMTTSEPPPKMSDTKRIKGKPSRAERSPKDFFGKAKVLDHAPCKNKHIYRQIPTMMEEPGDTKGG